jgi:predicted permease
MNLANMQLARATARRREVAIRLSVGASRFRLIRQLLTESILLSLCGGAAGLAFAYWAASGFRRVKLPFSFPVNFDLTPDWHVLLLTFAIAMMAGVGFGLVPALAATRTDLASTLKEGALAQMRGHRRFGMRNLLMVGQVAGSLTLLMIAGFVVLGFNKTSNVEIAFDPNTMYLLSLDPVRDGYSPEQATKLFDNLLDRLKGAPGVQDVVLASAPPFSPQAGIYNLSAPAEGGMAEQVVAGVAKQTVGAGYFSAVNVKMLAGREFDLRDQRTEPSPGKALPAVLNQTAVQAFFGGRDPVGRRISDAGKSYEVVGVVKDLSAPMSQSGRGSQVGSGAMAIVPVVYLPFTRNDFAHPPGGGMIVMVRGSAGAAGDTMQRVRAEIATIDPNLVLFNVRTLGEQVRDTVSYLRLTSMIYGGIGMFGLILAAIGLAGVTAYSVARRRKEIGIRMALGAKRTQVLRLVLREGGLLVVFGCAFGMAAAFALSRALLSTLFGPTLAAGAKDPRLIFGAPLLLAALAMLACYLPARKSTQIDPLKALREE